MKRCVVLVVCFVQFAVAQEQDSTSLGEAVQSFLGIHQPKLGMLAQLEGNVYDDGAKARFGGWINNFRLFLRGSFAKHFSYVFQGDFNGDYRMLDLQFSYHLSKNFTIDGGQFKAPFGNEYLLNDGKLRFINRSVAAEVIGIFRQQGVQCRGSLCKERLTFAAGLFNGTGTSFYENNASLIAIRSTFVPFRTVNEKNIRSLEVGGSAAYSEGIEGLSWLDYNVTFKRLYAGFFELQYHQYEIEAEYDVYPRSSGQTLSGFYVDVARKFEGDWELATRFDWMSDNYRRSLSRRDSPEIGRKYLFGANWYPEQDLKLQLNVEWDVSRKTSIMRFQLQYGINYE
jgi:phosphate-selective porin